MGLEGQGWGRVGLRARAGVGVGLRGDCKLEVARPCQPDAGIGFEMAGEPYGEGLRVTGEGSRVEGDGRWAMGE